MKVSVLHPCCTGFLCPFGAKHQGFTNRPYVEHRRVLIDGRRE